MDNIPLALTFDDVLLRPCYSSATSRKTLSVATQLTKKIRLNNPFISSPMDTVTANKMAVAMAQQGGLGIIHRFMSIEDQSEMVRRVKRTENTIITHPYTMKPSQTVGDVLDFQKSHNVGSLLVEDLGGKLVGLVTTRDIDFAYIKYGRENVKTVQISEIMIPRENIRVLEMRSGSMYPKIEEAQKLFVETRLKKCPIVDEENNIKGLITLKDIVRNIKRPFATLDSEGQLIVGAAVGVVGDYLERAKALVESGCDILCVDIAHGDSILGVTAVTTLKKIYGGVVEIMAGSVATFEGTKRLIEAGADCIRVGVGSGSICTTRIVTGFGVPQLHAVWECSRAAKGSGVTVISDGGTSGKSGNMVKAVAAGAGAIMLGSTLAGAKESPGKVLTKGGKRVKMIRGMAGTIANFKRGNDLMNFTPEGVEGYVPYKGPVSFIIKKLIGGLQSGISYAGGRNIEDLQKNAQFVRISKAGLRESHHHDILAI